MKIVFLGGLKRLAGESIELTIEKPVKLRDLINMLLEKLPGASEFLDPVKGVKPGFLMFINGVDYSLLGGIDATIDNDDVIHVVPVNHGG